MGRPKGSLNNPFKKALMVALSVADGDTNKMRKIADNLVEQALEGNLAAIKEIADRTDGKPAQAVTGKDGGPVQMAFFDPAKLKDLSDVELDAIERAADTLGFSLGNPDGEGEAEGSGEL